VFSGGPAGTGTLLGVPRADCLPPVFDTTHAAGRGAARTVRSSSSDAAAALQPDSNPQSPSADDSSAQPRRTSDPLCGGAAPAGGGQDPAKAAHAAEHVEIVISFDPHDPAASLSSVNSVGSGAPSAAKLPPPGYALTPPPILTPSFWSSASSLGHFPSTKFASSSSSAADLKPSAIPQSVSSCSLNPPSSSSAAAAAAGLFSASSALLSARSRHISASLSDRRQFSAPASAEYVCVRPRRRAPAADGRRSSGDSSDDAGEFRADRGSESTPLLSSQVRGRQRGVDVPASLICCTPPRRRYLPRPAHRSPSPLALPPRAADSPTDAAVAEFCAPRTRHQSLRRRRSSRRSALINAKHDKWHSIDLPDT